MRAQTCVSRLGMAGRFQERHCQGKGARLRTYSPPVPVPARPTHLTQGSHSKKPHREGAGPTPTRKETSGAKTTSSWAARHALGIHEEAAAVASKELHRFRSYLHELSSPSEKTWPREGRGEVLGGRGVSLSSAQNTPSTSPAPRPALQSGLTQRKTE